MGCDIHILVEFYDEEKKCWVLMKLNSETQKYEPFPVEKIERNPGEPEDEFELRQEEWYDELPNESVERNYYLFDYLANVCRGEYEEPLHLPKGFPLDISLEAGIASEYEDNYTYHNHTWYSAEELWKIEWESVSTAFNDQRGIGTLKRIVKRVYKQCERSRLLIWFDN